MLDPTQTLTAHVAPAVRLAAAAFGLLCATSAGAVDGVLEINDARALAGGVTSGDGPGYPVTLTEPGSYRLTGDLDVRGEASPANTTAVLVTASFVRIDLNGFSIVGPNVCAGSPPAGIGNGAGVASTADDVVVERGFIRGVGGDGLSLGARARVEGVDVSCSGGAGVRVGSESWISATRASLNGESGIRTGPSSVVRESVAQANTEYGLDLGAGTAYSGNQLSGNNGGAGNVQLAGADLVATGENACSASSSCESCGNGSCGPGETCASCSADCGACPACPNAICDPGETCSSCAADCGACSCGDGNVDAGEVCDDGNTAPGDACNPTCRFSNSVSLFAGSPGVPGTSDGVGPAARFGSGGGLATDGTYLYVADSASHSIRRIDVASASVTTLAGGAALPGYLDDPIGTNARFNGPAGLATDGATLWVSDTGNRRLRAVSLTPPHAVTTVAGSGGTVGGGCSGYADGIGAVAVIPAPREILHTPGLLYFLDSTALVLRSFDPVSGAVTTLAGSPCTSGSADGLPGTFVSPRYLGSDGTLLYISDTNGNRIRSYDPVAPTVATLAGSGPGYLDGSTAVALISRPRGIAFDGASLYFAEGDAHTIRQIALATGEVTTMVGSVGSPGSANGQGVLATLNGPFGLVYVPSAASLFVFESGNAVIRRIQ